MKKHITMIGTIAVGATVGWFSHAAMAKPPIAPCSIGGGIAISGNAQIGCAKGEGSFVEQLNQESLRTDGLLAANK